MAAKPLTTEAIALTEKKMDMALEDIIKMSKNTKTKPKKQQRVLNKSQKSSNTLAQDKFMKAKRLMDTRSSLRQGVLAQRRSNFQHNHFPLATDVARKAPAAPLRNRAFRSYKVANWNKSRSSMLFLFFLASYLDDRIIIECIPWDGTEMDGSWSTKTDSSVSGFVGDGVPPRRAANGGSYAKSQLLPQQGNAVPKQRSQTLDSLFANMKEQRMRILSRRRNNAEQHSGGGLRRPPWARGRVGN